MQVGEEVWHLSSRGDPAATTQTRCKAAETMAPRQSVRYWHSQQQELYVALRQEGGVVTANNSKCKPGITGLPKLPPPTAPDGKLLCAH